jgi:hypothetical protein
MELKPAMVENSRIVGAGKNPQRLLLGASGI